MQGTYAVPVDAGEVSKSVAAGRGTGERVQDPPTVGPLPFRGQCRPGELARRPGPTGVPTPLGKPRPTRRHITHLGHEGRGEVGVTRPDDTRTPSTPVTPGRPEPVGPTTQRPTPDRSLTRGQRSLCHHTRRGGGVGSDQGGPEGCEVVFLPLSLWSHPPP